MQPCYSENPYLAILDHHFVAVALVGLMVFYSVVGTIRAFINRNKTTIFDAEAGTYSESPKVTN